MIDLGSITQGERGTFTYTWQFPDSLTTPASILGATITAVMKNGNTGAVTAATGTMIGTAADEFTWAYSAEDSGTDSPFLVVLRAVVAGVATYTLPAQLIVEDNPAVDTVASPPLVGVSADLAAWLAASEAGGPLGTAAYEDTTAFDAAGAAATKLPLAGGTMTGDVLDLNETSKTATAVISGAFTLDAENGRNHNLSINGNVTFNLTNGVDGVCLVAAVYNVSGGTKTITWGTSVDVGSAATTATIGHNVVTYFIFNYFSLTSKWHLSVGNTGYSAGQVVNWWQLEEAGGAVQVFQPIGAATLAASYEDLSGNNNDATVGVAPTWNAIDGWIFNGSTQYLLSGIVPASENITIAVRFSNASAVASNQTLFGFYVDVDASLAIEIRHTSFQNNTLFANGSVGSNTTYTPNPTSGTLVIAGKTIYVNGVSAGTIAAGSMSNQIAPYIGALNYANSPTQFGISYMKAFAIWDNVLSPIQVQAISAAMAAL